MKPLRIDPRNRFESKIFPEPNSGCWLWTGYVKPDGYGRFSLRCRQIPAHRFSYTLYVGNIPNGLEIDHICKVRCCVNPNHLRLVTREENMAFRTQRSHCDNGHPFSEENTYLRPGTNGRQCRTCTRIWNNLSAKRRRSAKANRPPAPSAIPQPDQAEALLPVSPAEGLPRP